VAIPLLGQLPGPIVRVPPFPTALQSYLQLSADQVTAIARLNGAMQQFFGEKLRRMSQVQIELSQEMAKTTLDPMALGVRYVELEAIRREMRAQQEKTYLDVQQVLTAAQKTRLQALVEAMRLQPVACEAQGMNLLPAPTFPSGVTGGLIGRDPLPVVPGEAIASFVLGTPYCAVPAFRTGDFTFTPGREQTDGR
jgi:hypothetical protein